MEEPLDARVARTRSAVLSAGAVLLFTEGWDAVTHLRVAAVAGVGRATIYRHWPTVEDLLSDVLVDCQDPLPTPTPTGDLRADLVSAIELFADPLHTSKLGEILIATIDRAPTDSRIEAMQDAIVAIMRAPVLEIAQAAINRGALDASLTNEIVATYTVGPILYSRLFERRRIKTIEIERTVDVFLAAFEA